jgi:hypothetical protein
MTKNQAIGLSSLDSMSLKFGDEAEFQEERPQFHGLTTATDLLSHLARQVLKILFQHHGRVQQFLEKSSGIWINNM